MATTPTHAATHQAPTGLITGATQGLGRALATALADRGWRLILTARTGPDLDELAAALTERTSGRTELTVLAGDVADPVHRDTVVATVGDLGSLDLLVNNASTLGPTPLRALSDLEPSELSRVLDVNVVGPQALLRAVAPALEAAGGAVVSISSDAGVDHYETWGGYGASKAALDHLTLTWAAEVPSIRAYAFDPGDMRTAMHQAAFQGEDISDRPLPDEVAVPALLRLLDERPPSGRYRAAELVEAAADAPTAVAP